MDKPLHIDYERMTATVPLDNDPKVLVVCQGKARVYQLDDYGEITIKTNGGNIAFIKLSETDKF